MFNTEKIFNKIFGRKLASWEDKAVKLSLWTGVPALGLDALASTAYGPEATLTVLAGLGINGLHYLFPIYLIIIGVLLTLYLSYRQTIAAYPSGGGAYIVCSANIGKRCGVTAAVVLLADYLLNVAVGISAGIAALVSAFPMLQPYTLALCLLVLLTLSIINLRGVQEAGTLFVLPTIAFSGFLFIAIVCGLFETWMSGGQPHALAHLPPPKPVTDSLGIWILLAALANGLTAMTGIEAVTNAVPLFRKPVVPNAHKALTVILLLLALGLLGIAYLCPLYHIEGMDQMQPGYQTILAQLIAATTGRGIFYYLALVSIFIVLTYSAQTSFVDFPRICRLLAHDNFLPHFFAEKGRRLVFSFGIIFLTIAAGALLIFFNGITIRLIPLFAVGAFSAFVLSQVGMVVHWWRRRNQNLAYVKLFFNALGATCTFIGLVIIIMAKFMEGAWIIVLMAPLIVLLLLGINRHYRKTHKEIDKPLELQISKLILPAVIIPIDGWNRAAEKAVRFALFMSDDVTAVHISAEKEKKTKNLSEIWKEKVQKPIKEVGLKEPELKIIYTPYRAIYKPLLNYIEKVKEEKKDRIIAVVIPELVGAHWYENFLHNLHSAVLRTLIFLERDQRTVVITTPWYLRED